MLPTATAVVMGSAQKPDRFDGARLSADGVELARRRSGGGAVLIDPPAVVWIDVLAPRSSRWWSDGLVETFVEVGRAWRAGLASCGVETTICETAPERTAAASLACWAGVGWGELTLDGVKVVGLSQRRTRWGARIQGMAVLDRSAIRVADYFVGPDRLVVRAALQPSPTSTAEAPASIVGISRLEAAVLAELGSLNA